MIAILQIKGWAHWNMKVLPFNNVLVQFFLLLIVLGLVGCASDAQNVRYVQQMRAQPSILQGDKVHTTISLSTRERFEEPNGP